MPSSTLGAEGQETAQIQESEGVPNRGQDPVALAAVGTDIDQKLNILMQKD